MAVTYIDDIAGRIRDALPEQSQPDEDAWALYRLYALLALTTGTSTTLENVHDAWSAWMTAREPSHESLVPFTDLDPSTQAEDQPYVDAIVQVARW